MLTRALKAEGRECVACGVDHQSAGCFRQGLTAEKASTPCQMPIPDRRHRVNGTGDDIAHAQYENEQHGKGRQWPEDEQV